MKESRDMHELMIEYLYGELDDHQAEAFRKSLAERPDLAAELASLQRTREAVRGLPELDPSPAVTTRLLHEAAKQAEARAAHEAGGFFGWIADFFRPLVAHPALAAVGALVLIVGSAALLSRKGGVSEKAEVATEHAPAAAAPLEGEEKPKTVVVDTPAVAPVTVPQDQLADKETETAKTEKDNQETRRARATTEAEEKALGGTYGNERGGAANGPAAEPAKKAAKNAEADDGRYSEDEGRRPDTGSVAGGDKLEQKKEFYSTTPAAPPPPPPADRPAMDNASDRKADPAEQNRREQAPGGKADLAKSKDKAGYLDEDAEIQAPTPAPSKPAYRAPTPAQSKQKPVVTASPGRGTAGEAQASKPEPKPQEEAAPQGQVAGAVAPPEPSSPDANASSQQAQTKGGKEPSVQALHQQARQRVASHRCGDALAITREISRRDSQYYKRAVVGDRSAICEEPERAKQRAQPKSPSRDTTQEMPSDDVKAK